MKRNEILKKLALSFVFFFLEVILGTKYLPLLLPSIPTWIIDFGCYWAFTYVLLLVWTKPRYAMRFSLWAFVVFVVMVPFKMFQGDGFIVGVNVISSELIRLMRSPALPAVAIGIYLLKTKVFKNS